MPSHFNPYGAYNLPSGAPTIIDSYSETNRDSFYDLDSASLLGAAQSFAGANLTLDSFVLYARKFGLPTGNATPKVYAHSGVFGTSSVPGALLATGDVFDVSTLTTSFALTTFTFSGAQRIALSAGTNYVLALEYSGGDGSNVVWVGTDASTPTHGGNAAFNVGSWVADTWDICFYVYGV